jgi:hypothetical protein
LVLEEQEERMTNRNSRIGLAFAILLGALSVVGLLYVHVWSASPAEESHGHHHGKAHHESAKAGHEADVVIGSRVFIGDSRTSMGLLFGNTYGASGCDRDNDGNDVAVRVKLFNGDVLRERDANGPGDNGCAYLQFSTSNEPAYHQLLEYRGHSDTVVRRSAVSCHNPASRYC